MGYGALKSNIDQGRISVMITIAFS